MIGLELEIWPGVFHPKYFGSTSILANFVSSLPLRGRTFLEIGCGSGVVAMCAARAGAKVTAVDINPDAVRCTKANAERNKLIVTTSTSDVFSSIAPGRFDVIAWNPPFLQGEPDSFAGAAFFGGKDLDVIRRFIREARSYLEVDGAIYTILSSDVAIGRIEQLFGNEGFAVSRVHEARWRFGELMVILCAR
jgi:release factor glutamine methyltransferase